MCKVKFGLVVTSLLLLLAVAWAAEQPQRGRPTRIVDRDPRHMRFPAGSGEHGQIDQAWNENYSARAGLGVTASSPGLQVARMAWDLQSVDAVPHQIATNGSGRFIHFAWTEWIYLSHLKDGRGVNVNTYNSSSGVFLHGRDGVTISGIGGDTVSSHGGMPSLDVDDSDRAIVAIDQMNPLNISEYFTSWLMVQSTPTSSDFPAWQLPGSLSPNPDSNILWPHVTFEQHSGATAFCHVVAHVYAADNIVYWRFDGATWQGPVVIDSSRVISYNIAADRTNDKIALITNDEAIRTANPNGLRQVIYRESPDDGTSWINGSGLGDVYKSFITSYNDPKGPEAWFECVGDYDNAGNLHIVWNERRYASSQTSTQAAWKHWDKNSGAISTIHLAYWDNAGAAEARRINIGLPSLGFGDGSTTCNGQSNFDYIYLTFVQFGGPTASQQNDSSAAGYMNGDVYLAASANGGTTWSPAVNLTNTPSPGCNPRLGDSCQSENWPSMARTVDDTLHIMYIADRDAGAFTYNEGTFTYNPVMYYRIPGGTNSPIVCPAIAPNLAVALSNPRPDSVYTTGCGSSLTETLTVANLGPATLNGGISVIYIAPSSGTWLTVTGSGPFAVTSGNSISYPVVMNGDSLSPGLYRAEIHIGNNDTTEPNPLILPVTLEVTPGCVHQGDLDNNGVFDVMDVIKLINLVFMNGSPPISDPGCPTNRGDINCDRVEDVMDVLALIGYVFSNGVPPCGGCGV